MARVTLQVKDWTGDHETLPGEEVGTVLLAGLLLDGKPTAYTSASLMQWRGPGAEHDEDGSSVKNVHDFLAIQLCDVPEVVFESYAADPDNILWGSTKEQLSLPVTAIEVCRV